MMRTGIPSMLLGAVLVTSLLTGCKQGEGERCQIDDDCNTDFYCQLNGTREVGGYCRSATPTPLDLASMPDMSPVPPDMSVIPPDMSALPADMTKID